MQGFILKFCKKLGPRSSISGKVALGSSLAFITSSLPSLGVGRLPDSLFVSSVQEIRRMACVAHFIRPVHVLALSLLATIAPLGCSPEVDPAEGSTTETQSSATKPTKPGTSQNTVKRARTIGDIPGAGVELPPIAVVPPILDFGFIPPNVDSFGSVKLVNTSDKAVTILAVQPTCKCTTLNDLGGTVIPPGESVALEAALDGGPNPGPKTASVKVLIGGFARPIEVDLKAEISLPIRAIPPYINAVRDQSPTGRVVVESITGKTFRICSLHGKTPTFLGFNPETDEPRSKYILTYDLKNVPAPYPRYLMIVTDDPDVPVVDLYLRHETTMPQVNRSLRVHGGFRHPFGKIDQGTSIEMEVGLEVTGNRVATVISGTPDARVDLIGSRDETIDDKIITFHAIKVTPAKDFIGPLYFLMTFMTTGGQSADVPVFGLVGTAEGGCVAPTE
jgi:hypothetical protein